MKKANSARRIVNAVICAAMLLSGFLSALGTVPGAASAAAAADAGQASANLAANPGFEDSDSDWTGWTYDGTAGALTVKKDDPSSYNVRSGTHSVSFYSANDYQLTLSQTITGLENGDYALKAWASGDSGNKSLSLYAEGFGGTKLETPIVNTGWGNITSYTVTGIHVTNGQATIGFAVDGYGGKWGFFDDVEFRKVPTAPTWGPDKKLEGVAGPSSVVLSWSGANAPDSVTGYRIYRDGELIDTTTDTRYEAIDLQPGTTYTFAVQAGNAAGEWSADGPSADIATEAANGSPPAWAADKSLTVSGLTAHGAALSWTGASDATGIAQYRVYVNGKARASVMSATYALTGLSPGTAYTVRVEAGNAASLWSADGPTATFVTPAATGGAFIKGADVSTLQAIEDAGGKYYDNGQQQDLLAILRAHGVNYIRLRLWNDPVQAGGYNVKAHTLAMAKRVKDAGLKLLLDFHYSDFWADPGKQEKPAAWAALSYGDLQKAVYDYTSGVLNDLAAEGAYPDMVQVGNEINPGMLLPDGSAANYDKLAGLLNSGIKGVRDTTPPGQDVKIMLHLAEGGDNKAFRAFFDAMTQRGVDYDVIGMSYYPYWHGTLQQLKTNLDDMAARYGKQVVVAETSYGYTTADGDGWGNSFTQAEADKAGFPATVEGQKQLVTTVLNTVAHVPNGLGLGAFYWEPAWIPVPKDANGDYQAGWKIHEGNAWDNQAMFDFAGNALASLDAFRFEPGDLPDALPISVKASDGVTLPANVSAEEAAARLPASVDVLYNEGSIRAMPVDWQPIDPEALTRVGTFRLTGTVHGLGLTTQIQVSVSAYRNVLANPGFEEDYDFGGWTLEGTEGAAKIKDDAGNAFSGARAVNYYAASEFAFALSQKVADLPNGSYTLKARISGGGGDRSIRLFANGYGGEPLTADVFNTGWQKWNEATIAGIQVANHEATIGLSVDAPAGTWGWIDAFELYRDVALPEWGDDKKLTATETGADEIQLSWSGVKEPAGLAGYKIYQDGRKIATVTGTTYTATGLAADTAYAFKVEASYDGLVWTSTGPELAAKTSAAPATAGGGSTAGAGQAASGTESGQAASGTFALTAADLSGGGGTTAVTVTLPAGTVAVRLPEQASRLLSGRALELRAEGLELRIPASVLAELEKKLGADAAGGTITLKMEALGASEAASMRAELAARTGAAVSLLSGVYDFSLSIASADGKRTVSLTTFAEPIVVRFAAATAAASGAPANADTTGVFYLPDGAAPVYAGGKLQGGAYEAALRHFSRYALLNVDRTFADVPSDHWAYAAVRQLAARQYVQGVGGDRFAPAGAVTRAEFAAMLVRALGLADDGAAAGSAAFQDVPSNAWYAAAIATAAGNGLVQGRDAAAFDPNGAITRQEMAAMAVKAAALQGGGVTAPAQEAAGDLAARLAGRYNDAAAIAPWARAYIAAAADLQLAQGRGAGRFEPQATVTRAEAAQIVANVVGLGEAGN